MVQEKDAAKKRIEARKIAAEKRAADLERRTIKFKWGVIECTPAYNTGGYYDTDVPAKDVKVSKAFDSQEEAQSWMNNHEPDNGKTLFIQRYRLVRNEWESWVTY